MRAGTVPGVSVVVPTWNEAERLPRLLDALEACRPAPREVIVVDGGSTDPTVEVARGRATTMGAPRGRASQQNAGADRARGRVLWFLHADTLPPPDAVGQILAAVRAGVPGGCFRIAFPPDETRHSPLLPIVERGINARTRVTRAGTGDQGLFVRSDVFRAVGGFPAWPLFEDVRLAAAIRHVGRPAICDGPLVTSARRWLEEGVVRCMARMWTLRLAYLLGVPPDRLARAWRHRPRSGSPRLPGRDAGLS